MVENFAHISGGGRPGKVILFYRVDQSAYRRLEKLRPAVEFLPINYDDMNLAELRDDDFWKPPDNGGQVIVILDDALGVFKDRKVSPIFEDLLTVRRHHMNLNIIGTFRYVGSKNQQSLFSYPTESEQDQRY